MPGSSATKPTATRRRRAKVEVHPATALAKTENKLQILDVEEARRRDANEAKARQLFKEVIAPGAPDEHVALVFHYARALDLDPLRRQVMLLEMPRKNKEESAKQGRDVWDKTYTIVVGVHGLLGKVQRHPEYAGVASAAVYAGEQIRIRADQKVEHAYDPLTRPKDSAASVPMGAWATVTRVLAGQRIAHTAWVPFSECVLTTWDKSDPKKWKKVPRELWAKMPAWMNEKCAIAAAIRKAFDDEVGGVHVPEEFGGRTLPDGSVEVDASMAVPEAERETGTEVVTNAETAVAALPSGEPQGFDEEQERAGLRRRLVEVAAELAAGSGRIVVERQLDGTEWITDSEVLAACGSTTPINLAPATFDQLTTALETVQTINRGAAARGRR